MTPKEKAKELLSKFFPDLKSSLELELIGVRKKHAKKYASIAVDEILEAIDWHNFEVPNDEIWYWQEVKQEIENL